LAAFWKQETLAIPPVKSSPWHVVHSPTFDTAKLGWVESQSAGWEPPPGPGIKLEVVSLLLEHPARITSARIPQRIERQGRNLFPASIEAVPPNKKNDRYLSLQLARILIKLQSICRKSTIRETS
jgi:hypothetical protein